MTDYFDYELPLEEIRKISSLGLAHIGDAVYEMMVRAYLCARGKETSRDLHRSAVAYVSAPAQAKAMGKILPLLSEEEARVYRRGRNCHVNSVPARSTLEEYHSATGLEALVGYLYLSGQKQRINLLFSAVVEPDTVEE